MEVPIYSIGDSAFLEQILNSVALVTGSDSFVAIVSIGMLLGVLIMGWQAITTAGRGNVNFAQPLVCIILYLCFFAPKATVVIEDVYSGAVRPVDNIPLGVAAAGGLISSVGYGLTRLFEQGYAAIIPGITERQFVDSLKVLNDVRRKAAEPKVYQAINQALGDGTLLNVQSGTSGGAIDFRRSWHNYIKECALQNIDLSRVALDTMITQPVIEVLQFPSEIHTTLLYLDAGNPFGTTLTCSEAYTRLVERTGWALGTEQVKHALAESAGLTLFTGDDLYTRIQNSTSALTTAGAAAVNAQAYVQAAILESVYAEAVQGRYTDLRDFTNATMISQAMQQRNTQWSAEQSMFMSIVRPMLTFIEGFVYSISPIMAFLIVMGAYGITLVGKYIQMILWIQLWMPVLAIINLFIYMAATNEMASIGGAASGVGVAIDSFYGLNKSDQILGNWIALGGMLAAATPVLTLIMVTGSTFALNSLAQRLKGADHIDESVVSPAALSTAPVMANMPRNTTTNVAGSSGAGIDQLLPKFDIATTLQGATSSAERRASDERKEFGEELRNTFTDSANQTATYAVASHVGRNIAGSSSEGAQAVRNAANSFMKDHGIGAEHKDAVTGTFAMVAAGEATGSLSLTGLLGTFLKPKDSGKGNGQTGLGVGGRANTTGQIQDTDSTSVSVSGKDVAKYLEQADFNRSHGAQLTNTVAQGVNDTSTEQLTHQLGSERAQALKRASSDVLSTSQAYENISALLTRLGTSTNVPMDVAAHQVAQNPIAAAHLGSYVNTQADAPMKERINNLAAAYANPEGPYRMDEPKAFMAAAMTTLLDKQNHSSEDNYLNGVNVVGNAMSLALGRNLGSTPSMPHTQNADLVDAEPPSGSSLQAPQRIDHQETSRAAERTIPAASDSGPAFDHYQKKLSDTQQQGAAWGNTVHQGQLLSIADWVNNAPSPSTAFNTMGLREAGGAAASALGTAVGAEVGHAIGGSLHSLGQTVGRLSGMDDATLKSFVQAAENGEDLSRFQVNEGGLNGAAKWLLGKAARGMLGEEMTANMTAQEAAAVFLGQTAQTLSGTGDRVKEETLERSNEHMFARKYQEGLRMNLAPAQAEHYAAQFSLANQLNGIVGQMSDVLPGPSPVGIVSRVIDAAQNGDERAARIAIMHASAAHALGYEKFSDIPKTEQKTLSNAIDKSFEMIEAATANPSQQQSLLQYPIMLNMSANPRNITN